MSAKSKKVIDPIREPHSEREESPIQSEDIREQMVTPRSLKKHKKRSYRITEDETHAECERLPLQYDHRN